jgi:hypothetical protein
MLAASFDTLCDLAVPPCFERMLVERDDSQYDCHGLEYYLSDTHNTVYMWHWKTERVRNMQTDRMEIRLLYARTPRL